MAVRINEKGRISRLFKNDGGLMPAIIFLVIGCAGFGTSLGFELLFLGLYFFRYRALFLWRLLQTEVLRLWS